MKTDLETFACYGVSNSKDYEVSNANLYHLKFFKKFSKLKFSKLDNTPPFLLN